ncbi:Hypp8204 [Branchiostoma lanceolatum]|uniref:Hypp8204 protein n=1 Tax=Branchiostoma lanceolatum TaxID=7740 RepID=A0A8J9Z7G2_BRALA|nr:Hypp8204 [Branchiostoma lanceolatum]
MDGSFSLYLWELGGSGGTPSTSAQAQTSAAGSSHSTDGGVTQTTGVTGGAAQTSGSVGGTAQTTGSAGSGVGTRAATTAAAAGGPASSAATVNRQGRHASQGLGDLNKEGMGIVSVSLGLQWEYASLRRRVWQGSPVHRSGFGGADWILRKAPRSLFAGLGDGASGNLGIHSEDGGPP